MTRTTTLDSTRIARMFRAIAIPVAALTLAATMSATPPAFASALQHCKTVNGHTVCPDDEHHGDKDQHNGQSTKNGQSNNSSQPSNGAPPSNNGQPSSSPVQCQPSAFVPDGTPAGGHCDDGSTFGVQIQNPGPPPPSSPGGPQRSCQTTSFGPNGQPISSNCGSGNQPVGPEPGSAGAGAGGAMCQSLIALPDGATYSPCNPSLNGGPVRPGGEVDVYTFGNCTVYSYPDGRVVPLCGQVQHQGNPPPPSSSGSGGAMCQSLIALPDGAAWSPCNPSLNGGPVRPGGSVDIYSFGACTVYSYPDGRVDTSCGGQQTQGQTRP